MLGGLLKFGCMGFLVSVCGIGFALSSMIQSHMVQSYYQMAAEIEAATSRLDADTQEIIQNNTDEAVVRRITAEQREAANQYTALLIVIVIIVVVIMSVSVYLIARRVLDRYLQPFQSKLAELQADEARLHNPYTQYFSTFTPFGTRRSGNRI